MILNFKKIRQKNKTNKKKTELKNEELNIVYAAAIAAEEKKGEKVLLLNVSRLTVMADYFLIISTKSTTQIDAIAKYIEEKLSKLNQTLVSREGFLMSNWVILDFGNLVVHIMGEKERSYYNLERFWSNAPLIDSKLWKKAS